MVYEDGGPRFGDEGKERQDPMRNQEWAWDQLLPIDPTRFKWMIYAERGHTLKDASTWMGWSPTTIYGIIHKGRIHLKALFDVLDWKNHMRRKYNFNTLTIDELYEVIKADGMPPLFEFDFDKRKDYEREARKKKGINNG